MCIDGNGFFGHEVEAQMLKLQLTRRDVAAALDTTEEYVRKIVRGLVLPSGLVRAKLSALLKLNDRRVEKLLTADRVRKRLGQSVWTVAGKNPEMEPLYVVWNYLSEEHKADCIALALKWGKQDRKAHSSH